MKKLFTLALVLMLALALAACGNDAPAPADNPEAEPAQQQEQEQEPSDATPESAVAEPEQADLSAWEKTKTGKFYSRFTAGMYMEYETEYSGMVMSVVSATSNDKTYSQTMIDGKDAGASIMDGEYMYTIDHASKMIIKMSLQASSQEMVNTMIEEGDVDPATMISGQREIDGATYDTEEWSMEGATSIMCFDGDRLAYIIGQIGGEEMVLKVIKTSDQVDSSLFDLPADYQVVSY